MGRKTDELDHESDRISKIKAVKSNRDKLTARAREPENEGGGEKLELSLWKKD